MSRPGTLRITIALIVLLGSVAAADASYTVQRGDTLTGIAHRHGTSVEAIARANAIRNPDRIYVGQRLEIPGSATHHVVRPGETLSAIAARHGTTVEAIARSNGIADPNTVYVGTRLSLQPTAASDFDPAPERRIHVVRPGDTLSAIAARHGTTVRAIVEANGIPDPDRIRAGAALSIPVGGFVCPVPGASFFNDWGFARPGGRFHEGNDLFAPRGTPVLAPVSGTVEHFEGSIGGLQFRLRTPDGTTYIGTHLDRFGASGRVTAGEVIGYVGDTGSAKGGRPHLHFEIIPEGSGPINPYPTLVGACR